MSFIKLFKLARKRLNVIFSDPAVTVEFPAVYRQPPHGSRVSIRNNLAECTGCGICEKYCPVNCILIASEVFPEKEKIPTTSKGIIFEKKVTSFRIDYNQCVNCGICVDVCPTQALSFDKKFVFPRTRPSLLILDQVHRPRSIRVEQGIEE